MRALGGGCRWDTAAKVPWAAWVGRVNRKVIQAAASALAGLHLQISKPPLPTAAQRKAELGY